MKTGTSRSRGAALLMTLLLMWLGLVPGNAMAAGERGGTLVDMKGHWAQQYVDELVQRGITKGYPGDLFKPQNTLTRAEFVTFVMRTLGVTTPPQPTYDRFADTAAHWARAMIEAAVDAGVLVPSEYAEANGQFQPDQPITREDIAAMVVRALVAKQTGSGQTWPAPAFGDAGQLSAARAGFVAAAVGMKLVSGYPDGTFGPQKTASRAEAAAVLVRMLRQLENSATAAADQAQTTPAEPAQGQGQGQSATAARPGEWVHPGGYLNVKLGDGWEIRPITAREAFQGATSTTVVSLALTKGNHKATLVFGPAQSVPDQTVLQAVAASYGNVQTNGVAQREVAGQSTYVAEVIGVQKALITLTRRGDMFVHILLVPAADASTDTMYALLGEIAGATTAPKSLPADPTDGNPGIIGTWYRTDVSANNKGGSNSVSQSNTTLVLSQSGIARLMTSSYWGYTQSGYGASSGDSSSQDTQDSYYRVLGDIAYQYGQSLAIMQWALRPDGLMLGTELYHQ